VSDPGSSIAPVATEYAAVTERVAVRAAHFEGSGAPERGRANKVEMSTEPRVVIFMDTIRALGPEAGLQGFRI
jgi:hypothetical protein